MKYAKPELKFIDKRCVELMTDFVTPYGTIPKGFRSNGASVPKGFRWFAEPMGELLEGAIVHDYHYRYAIGTKEEADKIFRRVLRDFGVSTFKANVAYLAVKLFGKGGY